MNVMSITMFKRTLQGRVRSLLWVVPMWVFAALLAVGCSDDDDPTEGDGSTAVPPIALTYHHFIAPDDVEILDADTTQIAVSKALADKLGITEFSGRPMAIWQKVNCLPYIRRATAERLEGDRYILTVDNSASLADVLPENTELNFDTRIYVNHEAENVLSSAGGANLVEDISARYMDADTIHPAVVLYTEPGGAGEDVQVVEDNYPPVNMDFVQPNGNEGYAYATAEDLEPKNLNWTIINKEVKLVANLKLDAKADVSLGLTVPVKAKVNAKLQIKTGFSFKKGITLKKFDTGVYGGFAFKPDLTLKVGGTCTLPKDKFTKRLISFPGYTTVFMVGIVPVSITFNPGVIFKVDGTLTGSIGAGCSYRFENDFSAGVLYEGSWKAYGNYEQKENKFSMDIIKGNVNLNTGLGFYVSCDALIYGFAGPELAVGPRLGLTADATVTVPVSGDPTFNFNANLKCGVQSLVGAKLKILKWTLADWNTTFAISPQWTIWQYSTK